MSASIASETTLELLLADADHRPALASGLPESAAFGAPRPEKTPRGVDSLSLEAPDANPNDLTLQRWGIIIPNTPAGERALEAISALRDLRQSQQEAAIRVFRVEPGMDLPTSLAWKNQVLRNETALPEAERPKYLTILGDLDEVSAELGHVLANGSYVGRLHFDDPAGYQAYAEKVVRWERAPSTEKQALANFYVAEDNTPATNQGRTHLVKPCIDLAQRKLQHPFPADLADLWTDIATASDFLEKCNLNRPSILLSVSHGVGRSASKPWRDATEQRALQGALLLSLDRGRDGWLMAEHARAAPFLPGGLWFALACFGAGTPSKSSFYPWLSELAKVGDFGASVQSALRSLPTEGEKPFLAALPKAVLANPNGPLGMIAHLDLAWTYGFVDPHRMTQSRASRIFSALHAMANGSRAGVALDALMRAYREVNDELLTGYQAEEDARVWSRPFTPDRASRAHSFMLRNDLRGYVLLGDPAARLPLSGKEPTAKPTPSLTDTSKASPPSKRDVEQMARAVLAVLAQDGTMKQIAVQYGFERAELEQWVELYKAAGREALRKLP